MSIMAKIRPLVAKVPNRAKLASAAGISPAMVTRLANGERVPSVDVLERVAAVLGYRVALVRDRGAAAKAGKAGKRKVVRNGKA